MLRTKQAQGPELAERQRTPNAFGVADLILDILFSLVCLLVRVVKLQRSGTLGPRPLVRLCSTSERRVARENMNGKHTLLFNPMFGRSLRDRSHKV